MRIEVRARTGGMDVWEDDCVTAGYVVREVEMVGDKPLPLAERRAEHPDGSVVRMFEDRGGMDIAVCYPPGGTDRPTAPPTLPAFMPDTSSGNIARDEAIAMDLEADEAAEAATSDGENDAV